MAHERPSQRAVALAVWSALLLTLLSPVAIAAASPLQAWRDAAYITGGMAGVVALSLLVAQPLLAAGYVPGIGPALSVRLHRWLGRALVGCVALHIGGLYLSSPMDVMDALLLVSPTPFSVYGVAATLAVVATALLVFLRRRLRIPPRLWRLSHSALALVVIGATVVHAIMIDGAMGVWSKWLISAAAVIAGCAGVANTWLPRRR